MFGFSESVRWYGQGVKFDVEQMIGIHSKGLIERVIFVSKPVTSTSYSYVVNLKCGAEIDDT